MWLIYFMFDLIITYLKWPQKIRNKGVIMEQDGISNLK